MTKKWPLLLLPAVLVVAAACGDGEKGPGEPTAAPASPTAAGPAGQPTTSQPLPAPTPVPEDGLALQVVSGKEKYLPTLAEFKALPQTELDIKGAKHRGIALKDVVAKVPAGAAGVITIEGTTGDESRFGAIRFPLRDIADTTLLVVDAEGHLDIVSSSIPEEQWLKSVTGLSLT